VLLDKLYSSTIQITDCIVLWSTSSIRCHNCLYWPAISNTTSSTSKHYRVSCISKWISSDGHSTCNSILDELRDISDQRAFKNQLKSHLFLLHDAMLVGYMLSSCVCLSVCPSQAGTVPKWLNIGSDKQCHTVAYGLWFSDAKNLGEIPTRSSPNWAPIQVG